MPDTELLEIPTLGRHGAWLFGLLLVAMGVVAIRERSLAAFFTSRVG